MTQKMTPSAVVVGSLAILLTIAFMVVFWPWATMDKSPSEIYRTRNEQEEAGRRIYLANGCVYCHSQSIRTIDWDHGAERLSLIHI